MGGSLVDGRAPSEARWRLRGESVELLSPSGRAYVVPNGDVPFDVALGLLALRDATRFLATRSATGESAGAFALHAWLETSRDPLLVDRAGTGLSRDPDALVDGLPLHLPDGDVPSARGSTRSGSGSSTRYAAPKLARGCPQFRRARSARRAQALSTDFLPPTASATTPTRIALATVAVGPPTRAMAVAATKSPRGRIPMMRSVFEAHHPGRSSSGGRPRLQERRDRGGAHADLEDAHQREAREGRAGT